MPPKGYKMSLEQRREISRRMRERWANPTPAMLSQLERLHKSLKGRTFTPEWRQKISKAMMGNNNQEKIHSYSTKQKIAKSHKQLWQDPKRRSGLFTHEGRYESVEHYELKQKVKSRFLNEGFTVDLEYPIKVDGDLFIIDVYAKRFNEEIIIECGDCPNKKLKVLKSKYQNVLHIGYSNWRARLDAMKIEAKT